jgi:D-alanyl-D-alanine carboxypeptidase
MKNLIFNNSIFKTVNLILVCLSIAILLISCSDDPPIASSPTLAEDLQKTLDEGIVKYGGKGISVAVIMPDGYTWKGVSGVSHGSTKITSDMVFSAGSITKSFTASTIMLLAEEGKLGIDDSLHKWLPSFPNIDSTITIRQLLNHTSGIFNLTRHPTIWTEIFSDPGRIWDIEEMVRSFTLEPDFPKGTNWNYSNTGYLLLRMIIREASGSQISSEYRNRFFLPFGLTKSYLAIEENLHGSVAHGWFDYSGDGTYDDLNLISMNAFYSGIGGGVFCTAEELALWIKALLRDKVVVSQSSLNQMLDFHSPCPGEPMASGYGLGILRFEPSLFNGVNVLGHGGNAPGYAAGSFYLTDYNICIGIMDNTEYGDTMPVINDIITLLLNHLNN